MCLGGLFARPLEPMTGFMDRLHGPPLAPIVDHRDHSLPPEFMVDVKTPGIRGSPCTTHVIRSWIPPCLMCARGTCLARGSDAHLRADSPIRPQTRRPIFLIRRTFRHLIRGSIRSDAFPAWEAPSEPPQGLFLWALGGIRIRIKSEANRPSWRWGLRWRQCRCWKGGTCPARTRTPCAACGE